MPQLTARNTGLDHRFCQPFAASNTATDDVKLGHT